MKSLIVGGSGGLGRVIATELANRGDSVGLLARGPGKLAEIEQSLIAIGAMARSFVADALEPAQLDQAITRFEAWAGGLDAVVFAASRFRCVGPLAQADPEEWARDVSISLVGAMNVARLVMPRLAKSAMPSLSILVGPGHQRGQANASAYNAAQAGLVRLVECLALECEPAGVPVFAVFPGLTPVGQTGFLLESEEARRWLPEYTEAFAEGKEVEPDVVAHMITWLTNARPAQLSGRTVFALATPELLQLRLDRIAAEDRHRLRIN